MFNIREKSESEYELIIDGKLYADVEIGADPFHNFDITTLKHKTSLELSNHKISDFTLCNVETLHLGEWCKWNQLKNHIFITDLIHTLENYDVAFTFFPDLERWKQFYSFSEYFNLLTIEIEKHNDFVPKINPIESGEIDWFEIQFAVGGSGKNLFREITLRENYLHKLHKKILKTLLEAENNISIINSFDFPNELKISCGQYLLYFAQFLQDLGINATSNLKEEAGKVLFSVTPTDDIEALDKIREALAVYLNLPASPIEYSDSFAGMRLQQQVENLQHSQRMAVREIRISEKELRLAQTVVEHQDKIILQKDSIIDQKDKVIEKLSSKSIMTDSLENKEKLYEGLEFVPSEALKKYLGVIFQPVSFFKQIGTSLLGGEKEIISILDSDEVNNDKTGK